MAAGDADAGTDCSAVGVVGRAEPCIVGLAGCIAVEPDGRGGSIVSIPDNSPVLEVVVVEPPVAEPARVT